MALEAMDLPHVILTVVGEELPRTFEVSGMPWSGVESIKIRSNITYINNYLTPWLMEPGGSIPHSHRLSSNPYPDPNQSNSLY